MEQGIEKGEENAKEAIASKLIAAGMEVRLIAETTGFPEERIIKMLCETQE